MYNKKQMEMICNFKLKGYTIKQIIEDNNARIVATKGIVSRFLFKLTEKNI